MADLTGVNAFRFGIRKLTGDELDFATREGAEAVGKWAAGWATIYLGIYSADVISELGGTGGGAKDRIKNNLSYFQDLKDDGSITDAKYDWPVSTMRLLSQIAAESDSDAKQLLIDQCYIFNLELTTAEKDLFNYIADDYIADNPDNNNVSYIGEYL